MGSAKTSSGTKKLDLSKPDNYRGISLAQTASKIFNRLILNQITPAIDKVLRPNQNGFRENRSTSSHLLALQSLLEELMNHKQEAVLVFINFKKAFDSIEKHWTIYIEWKQIVNRFISTPRKPLFYI